MIVCKFMCTFVIPSIRYSHVYTINYKTNT